MINWRAVAYLGENVIGEVYGDAIVHDMSHDNNEWEVKIRSCDSSTLLSGHQNLSLLSSNRLGPEKPPMGHQINKDVTIEYTSTEKRCQTYTSEISTRCAKEFKSRSSCG